MCGIAGIISNCTDYNQITFLKSMLLKMRHRGPDGSGVEALNQMGCFGHNRLAILDLSDRAKQPIWDGKHRYCLTFNGEIYNYRDIKKDLVRLGHVFRTTSDSEVLVEAWAAWNVSTIDRLVGMFAFSVWDNQLKQLWLVRDRLGEKPLFFAKIKNDIKNGLVFASELKALITYPFLPKNISHNALDHYLSYGYTATSDCIYEKIKKLPPATYLLFDLHTQHYCIKPYWFLENYFNSKKNITEEDAKSTLTSLLSQSVHLQSQADAPLGAFLSGGIDSSSIVSMLAEQNVSRTNTFSIGFSEKSYNELPSSSKVAAFLSIPHYTKIISPKLSEVLPKIVNAFDEPFSDTSMIPTYFLSAFSRQFIKVSLSGDGGDELFGGYATYQADRYHNYLQCLPDFLKRRFTKWAHYLPTSLNKVSMDYKLKQFFHGLLLDAQSAHLSWRTIFNMQQKEMLVTDKTWVNKTNGDLNFFKPVSNCHYLDQAMYVDIKTWLVDDVLVKVDQTSMAHSLEVRAPFLDHRLVEFAASLPISFKKNKYVLKKSMAEKVPRFVLTQRKKGFNCPVSPWLKNELFSFAYDITTSQVFDDFLKKEVIERLWLEHQNGVCDNGYRLFNLLCLGLWLQGRHV